MGRPTDYSLELAAAICERIADGQSLKSICLSEEMPCKSTVYLWLARDNVFLDMYTRAREDQADTLADEIIDIADDGARDYIKQEDGREVVDYDHITRSRLRVDARKWVAAKLKPRKYGDRIEQHHSGEVTLSQLIKQSIDAPTQ